MNPLKIRLDRDLCTGHGRCYTLAPEIFGEDVRGHCVLKVSSIPTESEDAARTGVEACPEEALSLEE